MSIASVVECSDFGEQRWETSSRTLSVFMGTRIVISVSS